MFPILPLNQYNISAEILSFLQHSILSPANLPKKIFISTKKNAASKIRCTFIALLVHSLILYAAFYFSIQGIIVFFEFHCQIINLIIAAVNIFIFNIWEWCHTQRVFCIIQSQYADFFSGLNRYFPFINAFCWPSVIISTLYILQNIKFRRKFCSFTGSNQFNFKILVTVQSQPPKCYAFRRCGVSAK